MLILFICYLIYSFDVIYGHKLTQTNKPIPISTSGRWPMFREINLIVSMFIVRCASFEAGKQQDIAQNNNSKRLNPTANIYRVLIAFCFWYPLDHHSHNTMPSFIFWISSVKNETIKRWLNFHRPTTRNNPNTKLWKWGHQRPIFPHLSKLSAQ